MVHRCMHVPHWHKLCDYRLFPSLHTQNVLSEYVSELKTLNFLRHLTLQFKTPTEPKYALGVSARPSARPGMPEQAPPNKHRQQQQQQQHNHSCMHEKTHHYPGQRLVVGILPGLRQLCTGMYLS